LHGFGIHLVIQKQMCLGDGFAFQIPEKGIAARVLTDVVDGGDKYQEHGGCDTSVPQG